MSSGFISETEVAEARRRRQEQWDQVRTQDQPAEAPEEPYDARPLYQRLEEQKNKKDAEYEEAHKLKNMIRGLDDDEVGFLELVEQSKASVARQISLEEQREMKDFRERVSNVQDSVERERLQQISSVRPIPKKNPVNNTRNMLQGVIVRKRKISDSDSNGDHLPVKTKSHYVNGNGVKSDKDVETDSQTTCNGESKLSSAPIESSATSNMKCIGILPGIGPYKDSSDSECSSDSDDVRHNHPQFDLLGRKQECKEKTEKQH